MNNVSNRTRSWNMPTPRHDLPWEETVDWLLILILFLLMLATAALLVKLRMSG